MKALLRNAECVVLHAPWSDLATYVERQCGTVDALITDAPFRREVHEGHGTKKRHGTSVPPSYDSARRREIDYDHWDVDEVRAFVNRWSPLVSGWCGAFSDDELGVEWKRAWRAAGRLAFPLIPCTERGATVRLAGEGPSSCSTFLSVARGRSKRAMRAAIKLDYPAFHNVPRESKPMVGGKPVQLMREVIRAYTRPGDLVCDPCGGWMTTGVACVIEGRRFLGGDVSAARARAGANRLKAVCAGADF